MNFSTLLEQSGRDDITIDNNTITKPDLKYLDIDKDRYYKSNCCLKIFTIEFYQTMHDLEKQKQLILKMLKDCPYIRRFVCYYDYSPRIKEGTFSRHHYHGWLVTNSFVKLHSKYGSNKKGIVKKDYDLLIWMRSPYDKEGRQCTLDDMQEWKYYCEAYGNGFKN